MYIIFLKLNGYIEDTTTVSLINEKKGTLKSYEEKRNHIKYLMESKINKSGNYNAKFMKI